MAANSKPWQNRPSLISCWEHSLYGEDLSGLFVETVLMEMDGSPTPNVYVCVPRACRLTRICFNYFWGETVSVGNPDFYFQKSNNCGLSTSDTVISIPQGVGNFVSNCYCTDINVMLDECDVWKSFISFAQATTFPIFRVLLHFELR